MKQQARSLAKRALTKMSPDTADRLQGKAKAKADGAPSAGGRDQGLRVRVESLEREVQELRHVNRRLADVLDVMTELLIPAIDRDDAKVKSALDRLSAQR